MNKNLIRLSLVLKHMALGLLLLVAQLRGRSQARAARLQTINLVQIPKEEGDGEADATGGGTTDGKPSPGARQAGPGSAPLPPPAGPPPTDRGTPGSP